MRIVVGLVSAIALAASIGCGDSGGGRDDGDHDRPAPHTVRVVGVGDVQGNGSSDLTAISADARIVAFSSQATNLTPDAAGCALGCVFVYDRQMGSLTRLPIPGGQVMLPALSADGVLVAVTAFTSEGSAVVLFDRSTGTTERIDVRPDGTPSTAPGNFLTAPALSADGRFVAFGSDASDLVPGDTNRVTDVFVRDRELGTTTRVSVAGDGTEANATSGFFVGPSLSADGHLVAFKSAASNLVPDDHNDGVHCGSDGCADVFVHDLRTGSTERVSVASDGTEAHGSSGINISLAMSGDGSRVAFLSNATNLVPGDADRGTDFFDLYVRDRTNGVTTRVSAASDGTRADGSSAFHSMSLDGRFVAFASTATNLVADVRPGCSEGACSWVYLRELDTGITKLVNVADDGHASTRSAVFNPALSADAAVVAFSDFANDLVPSDTNGTSDVFVRGPLH